MANALSITKLKRTGSEEFAAKFVSDNPGERVYLSVTTIILGYIQHCVHCNPTLCALLSHVVCIVIPCCVHCMYVYCMY